MSQIIVQNVVITHIAMGEDIIAQQLRPTQPGAMADHQPAMGTQYGQMIRDRLRIGRADANIDQRDSVTVFPAQMIGRHLRQGGRGLPLLPGP